MGFHFGPDFHASSDPQISGFIVVLRAAEWFFILVLIFMIFRSAGFSFFRHIECSQKVFHFVADFYIVSSDQ